MIFSVVWYLFLMPFWHWSSFADKKVVVKHALKYSKLKDNQVSISPKYVITHTILSWRKSFCILGECCSKKISVSKSAAIHHSPRDRVFRLPKLGHISSSLLRTTYTHKMSVQQINIVIWINFIFYILNTRGLFNMQRRKQTYQPRERN